VSNDAAYRPTPVPNALANMPFVDVQTGMLTEYGVELLQKWRAYSVGGNRIIPCTATGTNLITLTPNDASPLLEQYFNHDIFPFVAAATTTGVVTMTVVPKTGSLATLKAYKTNGAAQATTNDIVANSLYVAIFSDHLDSAAGGFVVK